ncbi:MAG TPA: hypothetical protein VJR06_06230 [Nitrososphaerales archaeon]|nr:hypothetical protein [Nitrososphaerales archaeon]
MNEGTERTYKLVAWVSFIILVAVIVYGVAESAYVTGEPIGKVWVDVYFPFPPYFAQPVTYFSVATVALFYSGLRLWEDRISKWPGWLVSFLQLVGFVIAFSAAYEVMYNFMVWGSLFVIACEQGIASVTCNPDTLSTVYPSQWSLVFATRAFSALFVISGYSVYFLRKHSSSSLI